MGAIEWHWGFLSCFDAGVLIPDKLKVAWITPAFKGGDNK